MCFSNFNFNRKCFQMSYKIRKLLLRFYRKFKQFFKLNLISSTIFIEKFENQLDRAINTKDYRKLKKLITKLRPDFGPQKSSLLINNCIDSRSYDVLKYLLNNNLIDINCCINQYEWTAFHRAVYNKDIELILLLIENGANINVMDINGNTPFHILLQSSAQLFTRDNKSEPDFGVDNHYSIVILKQMLSYCKSQTVDVLNKRNSFGKTVLHYSVINMGTDEQTMLSLMSLLLDSGCDPDSRDRLNRTPLFCALNERSLSTEVKKQIVDKLIQSDCDSLNLYELKQFGTSFTLKQLSRSCLLKTNLMQTNLISQNLPKSLNSYLNIKLI